MGGTEKSSAVGDAGSSFRDVQTHVEWYTWMNNLMDKLATQNIYNSDYFVPTRGQGFQTAADHKNQVRAL